MIDRLRHSLLITHGTVYGTAAATEWTGFVAAAGSSFVPEVRATFTINGVAADYRASTLHGSLQVHTPIDFISWPQVGDQPVDLVEPWHGCLALYSRL